MASFKCKDLDVDCDFEQTAEDAEELLKKAKRHLKTVHNIEFAPSPWNVYIPLEKVKAAIKT